MQNYDLHQVYKPEPAIYKAYSVIDIDFKH